MAASGQKPGRLPELATAVQIDTTLHRSEIRVSHGFQRFDHSFNRTAVNQRVFRKHETVHKMNAPEETAYLEGAKATLQTTGLEVAPLRAPPGFPRGWADAWLRIGRGKNGVGYLVEVKRTVTAGTLGGVVAQLRDRAAQAAMPTLLVTRYLTPPAAEALRAQEQQFADLAGNAYLTGPAHYV
jgi:hypothetical protein